MQAMESAGVPNVYGPQRFGRHADNHLIGRAWLNGEHDEVVERLTVEDRNGRVESAVRAALRMAPHDQGGPRVGAESGTSAVDRSGAVGVVQCGTVRSNAGRDVEWSGPR